MINYNRTLILHGYGDMKSQIFWGHDPDYLGSRCHLSRDHRTRNMWFPIGDQL